jgi:outer membrane receptor for ferrienterochelin and colicins
MSSRSIRSAACALLVCYAFPAAADDAADLQSTLSETVTSTATTSAQKSSTAPGTSVTLTAEDLRIYGIRSLDEAINFLALGVITSDPLRTPDIGARGVLLPGDNGKHFLLLVNGHRLNDPLYGAARFDHGSGVPIEIIDHIEVIVGPGSVLYGSNAMMGVVNVITKEGSDYEGGHLLGEHEPGRSVRAGAGAGFSTTIFGESTEGTAHAGYYQRFGPDLDFDLHPFTLQIGTGAPLNYGPKIREPGRWGGTVRDAYFTEAGSGLVRWRIGDLELNLLGSTYRRGIPYTTGGANVDFDEGDSAELDRALRVDIKHQATLSALTQLTTRLYADTFDYQRRANRDAEVACLQSDIQTCQFYEAGLARWAGGEVRLSLNWFEDMSFVTLFGTDARMRWVSTKEDVIDSDTGDPVEATAGVIDDSAVLISPYVEQSWSPARWLDFNAGARLDAERRFDPIVSPRAAVAISPHSETTFKAVYSQAFRAPSWSETDPTSRRQIPSRDLEPEIVRSVEGSVEQRFSSQRILFGVFRTWWENLVEPHVLTAAELAAAQARGEVPLTAGSAVIRQFRNVSELDNYGYNAAWHGALLDAHVRYGTNVTAAYTRRSTAGETSRLPVAPQLFGNVHLAFVPADPLPTLGVAASYVGARVVERAFDGTFTDAEVPAAVEVRGTLSGPMPFIRGLSYRLSANYATASEGPYAVGPTQGVGASGSEPFLNPVDSFKVFYGLSYDFFTGEGAAEEGDAP